MTNLNSSSANTTFFWWGFIKKEEKVGGHFMTFMFTKDLMMVDWDPAPVGQEIDGIHYTISSKEEVYFILNERVAAYPNELWRVYETPSGGVHAFLVSHHVRPKQGEEIISSMKGDLIYKMLCKKQGYWSIRLSPKPGRPGDYIARFVGNWGNGSPLKDHLEVMDYHDSYLG